MFKRNKPLTALQHIKEVFWPTMGWRRALRYVKLKIIRLSDSHHKIALGLALGTAASFNPFVGTHFIQAGFFAYIFRANILAALIGTFVGNPWTFALMWWGSITLGIYILNILGPFGLDLPDHVTMGSVVEIVEQNPAGIFLPWVAGAYPAGALSMIVSYPIFYVIVRGAKAARVKAREHKIHKIAKEITGQKR